jgi:gluconate 2-dehydrogenase alpha chain
MGDPTEEPPVDVCVLGLGEAGGIVAAELATAGYSVVGIDKGPLWDFVDDFSLTKWDEWGAVYHHKFAHPLRVSTYTLRNDSMQLALPVRRYLIRQHFSPGHGVGGHGQRYDGEMGRYGPWVYQMKSETSSKYGGLIDTIAPTNDVEDWPMTYDDYEPYYVKFEKAWGVTGTNQGPLQPQSEDYPLPPHPYSAVGELGLTACESLGYRPYPTPTALASTTYVNSYGVPVNACVYDGWCGEKGNYVCQTGAKANSAYRTIPAALKTGNFSLVVNAYVFRIDVDPNTSKAIAARYYDAGGGVHVQPAKVFYNALWGFNVPRLFMLSGLGTPYDPVTVTGSMGRGPQYGSPPPGVASVSGSLDIGENLYPAGNASGGSVDILDLADDNFDHGGLNYVGGGMLHLGRYPGSGPKNLDPDGGVVSLLSATAQGSQFKAALKGFFVPSKTRVAIAMAGLELPDKRWYTDLDPNYVDWYGDPLARFTYNFGANAYNAATHLSGDASGPAARVLQKMGCTDITADEGVSPGDIPMDNYTAHIRGGCRMGSDPSTSALNKYGQMWDHSNVFAGGEVTDTVGSNTSGGSHAAGASAYVHAEGISKYLESPGPLV